MNTGKVIWFNERHGFGFIKPDDGGDDIFVHYSDIIEEGQIFNEGQRVSFTIGQNDKGQCATNVVAT